VRSVYLDCDGDVVLLRVDQKGGAACHTGKRSCFFRRLEDGRWLDVGEQVFDPKQVYGR
jgi:phosphoribosyl-AMP cyclohydrolase